MRPLRRKISPIAADIDRCDFGQHLIFPYDAEPASVTTATARPRRHLITPDSDWVVDLNRFDRNVHGIRGAGADGVGAVAVLCRAHAAAIALVKHEVAAGPRVDPAERHAR